MATILGLIGTESFSSERFTSIRRSVFYDYPNGAAPLLGLTSLLKRQESVNDPEFSWYEKRLVEKTTTTASNIAAGPFADTNGANLADNFTFTVGTPIRLKVASTSYFTVGNVIDIRLVPNTGATTTYDLKAVVTAVTSATYLTINPLKTQATVSNDTDANGLTVFIIGSAYAQGSLGGSLAPYRTPTNIGNYLQIFKKSFSISGTALKTSAKYDETGPYKDKAKDATLDHMIEMEMAFMFGEKSKSVDSTTNLPTYTMGGLLYFLRLWEAGATYGNTAATLDTDDNKRIITNSSGTLNEKTYDKYLERVFRVTSNKANEKLVLCGNGFLSVVNQMYKSKSVLNADFPQKDAYGMAVVRHVTPFGTVFYKTHPLYNQNSALRNAALFLDAGNLAYKYMEGRDTDLLKNRQPNDADYRQDEWLSECGLEVQFPESCMFLQNVTDYTP